MDCYSTIDNGALSHEQLKEQITFDFVVHSVNTRMSNPFFPLFLYFKTEWSCKKRF